ncbi:MAG TPA: YeeE/YedE thiosulfate transporter family protein, partial [Thermoanaerobaculia bacterium]|nr:YeeE/YedE thiosulfate transporter family protein [Thermoanaerobaculia bacterium]
GRLRGLVERGAGVSRSSRVAIAFAGGIVMGIGAVLARGCTSGLALTGGALLSAGAWLFMIAAFAGAYVFAPFVKRAWR